LSEVNKELIAAYEMGKAAEEFLKSELGRYLVGCADQEEKEAIEELLASSLRPREEKEIRGKVWRARSFKGWIAGLINEKENALDIIESRDNEDLV